MPGRRRRRPGPSPGGAAAPGAPAESPAPTESPSAAPAPARAVPSKRGDGLQIVPIGGLGEIGKNSTLIRLGRDGLVVDAGLMFPDEELPGIDLVIPDFGFLAIAMVQTEALRPAFLPACFGRDFFLIGYRIFARYRTRAGRTLRRRVSPEPPASSRWASIIRT